MNSSEQLQKALYNLFNTTYPCHEILPKDGIMPFILIGDEIVTRNDTKNSKRSIHAITVHTFNKGKSSLKDKQMKFFIQEKIENELTVDGFHVEFIELELISNNNELEESGSTIFHGLVEYRITLTEKE